MLIDSIMCPTNIKIVLTLYLFLEIQPGYGLPQGFFRQELSVPKFVSWDNREQSLNLPLNIKIGRPKPIKGPMFNVPEKQTAEGNTDMSRREPVNIDKIGSKDLNTNKNLLTHTDNARGTTNQEKNTGESNKVPQNVKLPNFREGDGVVSKLNEDENVTDSEVIDTELITESNVETTTDEYEYETTTLLELTNRSSPQLVASLLG